MQQNPKNNNPEDADSSSIEPSLDTNEKLKPCLELLEETINVGLSVIKEIVIELVTNNGPKTHILSWLLQSKKLSIVYGVCVASELKITLSCPVL